MLKQVKQWFGSNDKDSSVSSDLMARLGIMVFRCDAGKRYRRVSSIADWIYSFASEDIVIGDAHDLPFDFMKAYLNECDLIVENEGPFTDDAEIWHEQDNEGELRSLSARLFKLGDVPHLLVQSLDDTIGKKQLLYQRAREQSLTLEALAKADASLRDSNNKLELIMRQVPALFWCANVDGILTYCSGSAAGAFCENPDSFIGKSILEIFSESDAKPEVILSAHDIAVAGEASTYFTLCGGHSFDVRVEPLYDGTRKNIIGASGVCVESTERVKAEENAVAALKAKTDFVTGISHEIRTPMNAIIGLTELVLDLPLRKEQEVYLRSAISAGESLLSIIDQLLDFSRIEKGGHELDSIEFSPSILIYDVLSELAVHAHGKGIELVSIIDDDVPRIMRGDTGRLRQILVNLVGNAVKFTAKGEVQVRVTLESSNISLPNRMLHFAVCDTGIGVLPEKQELIFDAFRQAESGTIRKYGGSGLGLSISSHLTRLLGGQIWIVSPGKDDIGSEFHFTVVMSDAVPTESIAHPVVPPGAEFPSSCMLIAVQGSSQVEIYRMLSNMLGLVAQITVPADVAAPIDVPTADTSGVLVLEIPADIKSRERMFKHLTGIRESVSPIIAICPVGVPPNEMEDIRSFCDNVLLKPINSEELKTALLNTHKLDEVESKESKDNVAKRLRILVCDDSELNQWVIASICRNRGHELTLVSNGLDAVKQVKRRRFDVLLLDIRMPEIDGYEVTRRIRALETREENNQRYLPIIALTAHIRSGTKERCVASGMDGYLLKPVRLKALFRMIEKVLVLGKDDRDDADAGQTDTLDLETLKKLTGGNAGVEENVMVAVSELLEKTLIEVEDALQSLDFESVKNAAERIKNMSVEIGAHDLEVVAETLYNMASIQDVDGGRARLIELRSESDRLARLVFNEKV